MARFTVTVEHSISLEAADEDEAAALAPTALLAFLRDKARGPLLVTVNDDEYEGGATSVAPRTNLT